jgi:hypothetical protein
MENKGLIPLLNRAADGSFDLPADGWYEVAPKGEWPHAGSGTVQVLDETALAAMAAAAWRERSAETPPSAGILVDYDHFSYRPDQPSAAAGWIVALEARPAGLWGQIRWTPEGEAALRHGRYRFLSPVWLGADCEELPPVAAPGSVATAAPRRLRPLRLDSAGLTNNPNLRGMAPLSNRQGEAGENGTISGDAGELPAVSRRLPATTPVAAMGPEPHEPRTTNQTNTERTKMKKLLRELGLAEDASEDAAVAGLAALKNRAAELERFNSELLNATVEGDLERHQHRFEPGAREQWKCALLANREAALGLLASIATAAPPTANAPSARVPLHNRATAGTPRTQPGLEDPETRAGKRKAAVAAYQNRHQCSFERAWQGVKAESPGLFTDDQG